MTAGCPRPSLIKLDKIHTFFKADFKSDYSFKGERHSWWEMVFVISGSVSVTAQSDIYTLQAGQGIVHRPDEFHQIRSESSSEPSVIVISFSAENFPNLKGRIFNLDLLAMEEIQKLCSLSNECFVRNNINTEGIKDPIKAQEVWLKTELFIFKILTGSKAETTEEHSTTAKSAELYSLAVRLMEDHPDKAYSTEEIAAKFSISGAYLKKIFKKYAGCGVIQYYNRLKARLACTYLDQGKSVKETAALLGFGDQNNFSNFFKRVTGKSPTEYKNKQGNQQKNTAIGQICSF